MNLTTESIPQMIRKIAIPSSIGMFFYTMYNIVDTYFAGLISTDAQAALSLSFPLYFVIIAFSAGIGQALTSLLANYIGAQKLQDGKILIFQAQTLAIIISIVITVLGISFTPYIFTWMGASGNYHLLSVQYMNTLSAGTLFFIMQNTFNAVLSATGNTLPYRNILIFSFLLNLILDPLFMFGYKFIPAMGIIGLGLATLVSQLVGCMYMYYHLRKSSLWSKGNIKDFIPQKEFVLKLVQLGAPVTFSMLTISFGIFVMTYIIGVFGKVGVAAYGIASRIEQIALLPVLGLNTAVMAIVGQNNGAKLYDRVEKTWYTAISYALIIIFMGACLVFLFATYLMQLFSNDNEVVNIGITYLKFSAFILPSYILIFITNSLLQGLKRPVFIMWVGLARQLIIPLIVYPIIAIYLKFELIGIWYSLFVIQWMACVVTVLYGKHILKLIRS